MLLKRIEETINLFDVTLSSKVEVGLFEPVMGEEVVYWKLVAKRQSVSRACLHYNDAADGSNKLNGCWRKFYESSANLGEFPLYNGTSIYFTGNKPNFGGVIKSAIYLRYSKGFLNWLSSFDSPAAEQLQKEKTNFDSRIIKSIKDNKQWCKYDKSTTKEIDWPLTAICRLSNGKYLVLWLDKNCPEDKNLEKLQIDVPHSTKLMSFLVEAEKTTRVKIHEEFQSASGRGRNPFGETIGEEKECYYHPDAAPESEFMRLLGYIPASNSIKIKMRQVLNTRLGYPIHATSFPNSSRLMFLSEGDVSYNTLKNFATDQADRWKIYEKWKNQKKKKFDENEETIVKPPQLLAIHGKCTAFLISRIPDNNKPVQIIQSVFPSVSLQYLARLNNEFFASKTDYDIIEYMRHALLGGRGSSPCIYQYWTNVFTSALQHREISAWEVYNRFPSYLRSYPYNKLSSDVVGKYFNLVGKLLRLQQIIIISKNGSKDSKQENNFEAKLEKIGTFKLFPKKGVFGDMNDMNKEMPSGKEILGETYEYLNGNLKIRFDEFAQKVWGGMPNSEFHMTMRGVLTGMLLSELARQLNHLGRSFLVTQGRHSSQLRGQDLIKVFALGMDLLTNLGVNPRFSRRLTPFILSIEQESNQESFNIGFTCGVFYQNSKEFNKQEVKHD